MCVVVKGKSGPGFQRVGLQMCVLNRTACIQKKPFTHTQSGVGNICVVLSLYLY